MNYSCRIPAKIIGILDLILSLVSLFLLAWTIVIPAFVATVSLPKLLRQNSVSNPINATTLAIPERSFQSNGEVDSQNATSTNLNGHEDLAVAEENHDMEKIAISIVSMTFFWIFILIVMALKMMTVVANVRLIRSTDRDLSPSKAKVRADFWLVFAIPLTELLVVYVAYQLLFSFRSPLFSLFSILFYVVGIIVVYGYVRELGTAEDIEESFQEQRIKVGRFLEPEEISNK